MLHFFLACGRHCSVLLRNGGVFVNYPPPPTPPCRSDRLISLQRFPSLFDKFNPPFLHLRGWVCRCVITEVAPVAPTRCETSHRRHLRANHTANTHAPEQRLRQRGRSHDSARYQIHPSLADVPAPSRDVVNPAALGVGAAPRGAGHGL